MNNKKKIESYLLKSAKEKIFSLVQYDDKPGLEYGIVANDDLRLNTSYDKFKFAIGKVYMVIWSYKIKHHYESLHKDVPIPSEFEISDKEIKAVKNLKI